MATYTYQTTDEQERGLEWYLAAINANRAGSDPPERPITAGQLIHQRIGDAIAPLITGMHKAEADAVARAFAEADDTAKEAVRAALSLADEAKA